MAQYSQFMANLRCAEERSSGPVILYGSLFHLFALLEKLILGFRAPVSHFKTTTSGKRCHDDEGRTLSGRSLVRHSIWITLYHSFLRGGGNVLSYTNISGSGSEEPT